MKNLAIMILAAGGSARMGKPKLAEKINGQSILENVLKSVSSFTESKKMIILGCHKEVYQPLISKSDFEIVENENWTEGISSSIRRGIEYILSENSVNVDSVMILLADMALVSEDYLKKFLKKGRASGKGIVASDYGPSLGPPVIFDRKYFFELLEQEGDLGAKNVIFSHRDDLEKVDFPNGLIDIDTPEDLQQLHDRK